MIEVYTRYSGRSYTIYRYLGGGRLDRIYTSDEYRPYIYAFFRDSGDAEKICRRGEVVGCEESPDIDAYVFSDEPMRYVKSELKAYRVYTYTPSEINAVRNAIRRIGGKYGGIIKFDARASIDYYSSRMLDLLFMDIDSVGPELLNYIRSQRLKILAFDIEVSSGTQVRAGESRILSASYAISWAGGQAESYVDIDPEPRDVVEAISSAEPDVVVGYNSLGFDLKFVCSDPDVCSYSDRYIYTDSGAYMHIDLYLLAQAMRSALALRSTTSLSLEDVALELGIVDRGSEFYRLKAIATPENIDRWYREDKDRFKRYSRLDSEVALKIAQLWIPILLAISRISYIPLSMLQQLAPGTIDEYIIFRFLERLGIVTEYRESVYTYGKIGSGIYGMGKVYSAQPGIYRDVQVYDFDQLYPTIYTYFQLDPIASFASSEPIHRGSFKILLKNASGGAVRELIYNPCPGPVSYLLSKFYFIRRKIKELKKKSGDEVYSVMDKAFKILSNAAFGALSKDSGNIINEAVSAYIFYRSNQILLELIEKLKGRVVYGDTDSVFVAGSPEGIDDLVSGFGKLFSVKHEGSYRLMLIPASASASAPARKSYILVGDGEVVLKGIFFKEPLPEYLDERREEFFRALVLGDDPSNLLYSYTVETARSEPHKLFYRSSVKPDFTVAGNGSRRLKIISNVKNYILLYLLAREGYARKDKHGVVIDVHEVEDKLPLLVGIRYMFRVGQPSRFMFVESIDPLKIKYVRMSKVQIDGMRYRFIYAESDYAFSSYEKLAKDIYNSVSHNISSIVRMIQAARQRKLSS